MKDNAITWFEIPAVNFERAVTFYETVLGEPLRRGEFDGLPHGFFGGEGVAGAVVQGRMKPGAVGTLVYLNAGGSIEAIVARIEAAGGAIILPVIGIGPQGQMAILRDTEGNHVGLHQPA